MSVEDGARFEEAAREAARRAGVVLRRRFRETAALQVETKGLHDFVTEVDREAETAVIDHLRSLYPEHAILAEESAPRAPEAALRWIVDPLDGTTNFIHGVPTFAVSIALEDREGLLAGVVYDPFHDEMFHAHRGGGAYLDGAPIRCTHVPALDDALIATGFPFRELERLDRYLSAFRAFVRGTSGLRRAGSAALDLAFTACGRYDGFWEVGLSPWDIAAGALLVREAGGAVTDAIGGNDFLTSGQIVASGTAIHREMLEITRESFG
jgi:myo-inositol-1(or 4)-monophosphatase